MKLFLTKLKTKLLYKNLLDNYHFIVIGIVLIGLIYIFKEVLFIIIFIILIGYLFIKNPKLAFFALFIFLIFTGGLIIREIEYKNRILGEKTTSMVVIESKKTENGYKLTLKNKKLKYYLNTTNYYNIGDVLYIKGIFTDIDSNHIPLLFNYQNYSKYQGIIGNIKEETIIKKENRFVVEKIQKVFLDYYDNNYSNLSASYLKALVLGYKSSLDEEVLSNINSLGISHLFVVSGLHVSLLIGIITRIINKLVKKENVVKVITTFVLISYSLITNLMVSVLRVVIAYIIKNINQKYQMHLSTLDILSIVTILLLLINPYFLFTSSFILSFGLTYSLIVGSQILKEKNFLKSLIKMSIYCQIISIPLSYNFSNKINILSILFNLIFVPFVTYLFLPLSLIISFLPFLNNIYEILIKVFEWLVGLSDSISFFINLPTLNIVYLSVFFIIIYILFKMLEKRNVRKVIYIILFIYMLFWINYVKFDIYDEIIFFDLPNGESTLIHKAFNKYNILIDTGDIPLSDNPILTYLNKRGIDKIDFVVITHSDSDHIGGLKSLMEEIKVDNIITGFFENKRIFEEYKKYNKDLKIYYLKKGYNFSYKNIQFNTLLPLNNLGDVNNNSLVFLLDVDNFRILFTGDIEEKAEKTFEGYITCDLLKIAHHGSKTSTTIEFLEKVNYQTAIIMNGYYNIFGFPSKTVINRIKNKPYYITGLEKTIIYRKLFFKEKFVKRKNLI